MDKTNKGRSRVVVYPDWCKGCGICAAFCPKQVLAIGPDGKACVVRDDACVNCGFCEPHCPDFAIRVVPPEGDCRPNGQTPRSSSFEPVPGTDDFPAGEGQGRQ